VNCRLKTDSDHLKVEEDKLKVVWHAAAIEKWLVGREQNFFFLSSGHEICWINARGYKEMSSILADQ
jgi:hypothetical protein